MERRAFMGLGVSLTAGLAGCAAKALSRPAVMETHTPESDCPVVIDVDRVYCPGDDGPVGVARTNRTVSGDSWSVVVRVTNQTEKSLSLNPDGWALLSRSQDGWQPVVPAPRVGQSWELRPQQRYEWQLTAGSPGLSDPDRWVSLDLTAGEYTFAVPLRGEQRYGAVAPFEVID
jgi:hypothetical protein